MLTTWHGCFKEKKRSRVSEETPAEKAARTDTAANRRLRSLSGWNIFQKEKMSGLVLNPVEYRQKVKEVSAEWKGLGHEAREPYNLEAAHQQQLRDKLAATPLAISQDLETQALENQVGKSGCSKLSARRLQLNVQAQAGHPLWSVKTQYADSGMASMQWIDFLSLFVDLGWLKKKQCQIGHRLYFVSLKHTSICFDFDMICDMICFM